MKFLSLIFCLLFYIAPTVSPTVTNTIRSIDGSCILIVWTAITFDQAGGFFEYNIVISMVMNGKIQTENKVFRVPYNETSYNVTDLNNGATYMVSMSVSVDDGTGQEQLTGPISDPIEVSSHGMHS